jgi:hypothetical protein
VAQDARAAAQAVRRFTRREAAARYGVDEKTIRNAERAGTLTPYTDDRGVIRYLATDLASWAASRRTKTMSRGQLESEVFRALDAGKRLKDVMIEYSLTTRELERLHRAWRAVTDHEDLRAPLELRARR